jgi:phospholipase C
MVGPAELSEHATYGSQDGAWLQRQIVEAVINRAGYNETILMISYDNKLSSRHGEEFSD